jgi:hypothetical protein
MFIQCTKLQSSKHFWTTHTFSWSCPTRVIFKWPLREPQRLTDFLSKYLIFLHDYILIKIPKIEYEMHLVTDYSKIECEEHSCLDTRLNAISKLFMYSSHAYPTVCHLLIRSVSLLSCRATENADCKNNGCVVGCQSDFTTDDYVTISSFHVKINILLQESLGTWRSGNRIQREHACTVTLRK